MKFKKYKSLLSVKKLLFEYLDDLDFSLDDSPKIYYIFSRLSYKKYHHYGNFTNTRIIDFNPYLWLYQRQNLINFKEVSKCCNINYSTLISRVSKISNDSRTILEIDSENFFPDSRVLVDYITFNFLK